MQNICVIILETFKSLKFPENLSLEQTTTKILMLLSLVTFISTLQNNGQTTDHKIS